MCLFFIFLVFLVVYLYYANTLNYWKKKGIKYETPFAFFGRNAKLILQRVSLVEIVTDIYRRHPDEKVVGFYCAKSPALVVRDPRIIKRILVTDSQHFTSRGISLNADKNEDCIFKSLLFLEGDLWRFMRQAFIPAFSSTRLRSMFTYITKNVNKLQILAEQISRLESYDMQALYQEFTMELTAAYGFGVNSDFFSKNYSKLSELGIELLRRTPKQVIVFIAKILFPSIFRKLTFFNPNIINSTQDLVNSIMQERICKQSNQNDFIDIFHEFKEKGCKIIGNFKENKNNDRSLLREIVHVEDSMMIAQTILFFVAGFHTSTITSSYVLHELAFHFEYQSKIQREIDSVLNKHNNEITFEALKQMKYLKKALRESLRMHPSVGELTRMCTSSQYVIPEINLKIDRGVILFIPVEALHTDKQYFEEPDIFQPERFDSLQNDKLDFIYMPYGRGPRSCVGAKLGEMQVMAGLAAVLQKFTVEPASCTVRNPPPDPSSIFVESFSGGFPLKLIKRQK